MIDIACDLVGQEVLQKTMSDEDPKNRTAALRALLKRADQKLNRELFTLDREKFEFDAANIDHDYPGLPVALDGELVPLQPPYRFRTRPGALRVIMPRAACDRK